MIDESIPTCDERKSEIKKRPNRKTEKERKKIPNEPTTSTLNSNPEPQQQQHGTKKNIVK